MPGTDRKFRLNPKMAKTIKTAANPMNSPAAGLRKNAPSEKPVEVEDSSEANFYAALETSGMAA